MANAGSPYEVVASWYEPQSLFWTSDYLKTLLVERHNIRAAIENPGGSVITSGVAQAADADQLPSYSSEMGNASHLDLIEAEREVLTLEARDRIELLAWCDGLSVKQAADWANIKGGRIRANGVHASRKRINRSIKKVAAKVQSHDE